MNNCHVILNQLHTPILRVYELCSNKLVRTHLYSAVLSISTHIHVIHAATDDGQTENSVCRNVCKLIKLHHRMMLTGMMCVCCLRCLCALPLSKWETWIELVHAEQWPISMSMLIFASHFRSLINFKIYQIQSTHTSVQFRVFTWI